MSVVRILVEDLGQPGTVFWMRNAAFHSGWLLGVLCILLWHLWLFNHSCQHCFLTRFSLVSTNWTLARPNTLFYAFVLIAVSAVIALSRLILMLAIYMFHHGTTSDEIRMKYLQICLDCNCLFVWNGHVKKCKGHVQSKEIWNIATCCVWWPCPKSPCVS